MQQFYQDGEAEVSAEAVRVGTVSVAVANVALASLERVPGSRVPGVVVALAGVGAGGACLATGSESQAVGVVFGLVALVLGLGMALSAHDRYLLRLELVGGKVRKAALGRDRDRAEAVVAAANHAVRAFRSGEGAEQKKPPAT